MPTAAWAVLPIGSEDFGFCACGPKTCRGFVLGDKAGVGGETQLKNRQMQTRGNALHCKYDFILYIKPSKTLRHTLSLKQKTEHHV